MSEELIDFATIFVTYHQFYQCEKRKKDWSTITVAPIKVPRQVDTEGPLKSIFPDWLVAYSTMPLTHQLHVCIDKDINILIYVYKHCIKSNTATNIKILLCYLTPY